MTLLAAIGFASTNIGDTVAGRARIATENVTLAERIGQIRKERNAITEIRSADAIEIELQTRAASHPGCLGQLQTAVAT